MKVRSLYHWVVMIGIVLCSAIVSSGSVFGAGFALIEQGVSGLGNAYAGGAASAEDASTIFFNPAGMTRLAGNEIVVGAHVIMPYLKFENEGSTHVLQPLTGIALQGGNGGEAGETRVVPNLYYSRRVSDRFVVGIGVNAPFGLATKYERGWVGRYHAIESDLMSININPSIAYKVNDTLSIGAGLSAQFIKATLSKEIDFGLAGVRSGIPGLLPQRNDGFVELEGDSWGVGFNIGLLVELSKDTRFGAAYRSRVEHTLEGEADFSGVPLPLASGFRDSDVEADVTLPDSMSLSFFHRIHPQWAVMADFSWTNWSLFDELRVKFKQPGRPDDVTVENWQDSYRYSLGAMYTPNDAWTIRVGTAYDTSAVSEAKYRTPRIPDGDRIWAAVGVGYKLSDLFRFDVGYAHLFINDPEIKKTAAGEDAARGGLKGTFDASIDIVSAQLTMRF